MVEIISTRQDRYIYIYTYIPIYLQATEVLVLTLIVTTFFISYSGEGTVNPNSRSSTVYDMIFPSRITCAREKYVFVAYDCVFNFSFINIIQYMKNDISDSHALFSYNYNISFSTSLRTRNL